MFRRLSVFAGSFTIDAAQGVVLSARSSVFSSGESEPRTSKQRLKAGLNTLLDGGTQSEIDVLDGISSLVDKSLLVSKEQANGDARFRMLEVVREYALEALNASGELDAMNRGHAAYYYALGAEAEPYLQAAQSSEWLNRLEEEHDNLRAALRWAKEGDPGLGWQMAGALWRFWWLHGHIREGCDQLGAFLSQTDAADKKARTKMLLGLAFLNRLRGNFESARSCAEEGLALAEETGDKKSGAFSLYQLALLTLDDQHVDLAGSLFEKGLLLARESGDRQVLALLLNGLGELSRSRADYAKAGEFYQQALAINREIGDLTRQVTNLINLGATAISQNDLTAAGEFYRDGLQISSKMADMNGTLYCLEGVAGSFWATRDTKRAALLFGAADAARGKHNLLIEPADRLPYEQSVVLVRDSLTESVFAECFSKGNRLELDESIALALSEPATYETKRKR